MTVLYIYVDVSHINVYEEHINNRIALFHFQHHMYFTKMSINVYEFIFIITYICFYNRELLFFQLI